MDIYVQSVIRACGLPNVFLLDRVSKYYYYYIFSFLQPFCMNNDSDETRLALCTQNIIIKRRAIAVLNELHNIYNNNARITVNKDRFRAVFCCCFFFFNRLYEDLSRVHAASRDRTRTDDDMTTRIRMYV